MDGLRVSEDELRDLAKRLRDTGQDDLVKDMLKRLQTEVAKPIVKATRQAAITKLPAGGGLNKRVAKAPQRLTARAGDTTATVGVIVSGKKRGNAASQTDRGFVRHPVFNRLQADGRRVFVSQKVEPGWFTNAAAETASEEYRRAADQIMDDVAKRAGFR